MTRGIIGTLVAIGLAALSAAGQSRDSAPAADGAADHHRRGVDFHLQRRLDEASREYARALAIDPARDATGSELALVRRMAPRVFVTPTEFFSLKDAAAVLHPAERLIAYHLFWEDDIDFPEDNDPCDHEVVWVQYTADASSVERFWTYFHGRILDAGDAAVRDARAHGMRPRVNVQWGKHGSMPVEWEQMPITPDSGDSERNYYPVGRPITLSIYNRGTYQKLRSEGRRLPDHPIGRRLGWPARFDGAWEQFVAFSKPVSFLELLDERKMIRVSRWNSAVINQHFLPYNFRPKTEWPQ